MKVEEVLNELSVTGNTIARVAKEKVGIAEKRLKKALHTAGYEYKNSGKRGWFYVGDGTPPLDSSIHDFIVSSNVNIKKTFSSPTSSHNVKGNHTSDSCEVQFTNEELSALKNLIGEYLNEKQHQTKRDVLHKRIMTLEKSDKVRKTIVISNTVGNKLDEFATATRFNKSDLLEIAILDLINRYE